MAKYYAPNTAVGQGLDLVIRPGNVLWSLVTAIAPEPFPRHDRQWLQSTISYKEFAVAVKKGEERFQSEVLPKLRESDPRYRIIGIRRARENGVNPIPR